MGSQWGRIDANGTVYVRTADGEREIGSWQAGDTEAGLAFYTQRYEDLAVEVSLLEQRLESGAGDPRETRTHAEALRARLPGAAAIGDLDALDARLQHVLEMAEAKAQESAAARQQARADAVAAKERLVDEAEQIAAASTSWKASGERLRTIVEEWKQIRGVDRKTDDALWRRFGAARDAFGKRRDRHFAQRDSARAEAREKKEQLIAQAEQLAQSSDWKQTAGALRELMDEWRSVGNAGREAEEALWTRFRAARDTFYERRSGVFAERDAEQVDNQKKKEAIIAEAEALELADPKRAQSELRALQSRFDDIGHVPRDSMRRIDARMRAAEQRVREALDAQWRQPAAESNPFLVALRERLAEAEQKLERARKSGDAERIARAEAEVAERRALLPE
jgi:hypothetical protein